MAYLSRYFLGVAGKRLKTVEIEPIKSNQHEFNGVQGLKKILGTEKIKFKGRFLFLSDNEENSLEEFGSLTWYDSREGVSHRSPEFRLYYSPNNVIYTASVGDLVIIAKTKTDELLVIVSEAGSTSEQQLMWLFGLSEVENKFEIKDLSEGYQKIDFAAKRIIEALGVDIEDENSISHEEMFERFGTVFPATNTFSEFARSTVSHVFPVEDPDVTLIKWMDQEERLFKIFEKALVEKKLKEGFGSNGHDVDEFISFSLSVQNRRKARAGYAFENHLAKIFDANNIHYSRGKVTELNKKPDFVFPSIDAYHNVNFESSLLTMLGLKTTAKDRWRQVLSEAAKIERKHLITLEPAISRNQTDEMFAANLQLVIPKPLFSTYSLIQQGQLIHLADFITEVRSKQ